MVQRLPLQDYVNGILTGNRVMLSRSITLAESSLPSDQDLARQVIDHILPYTGHSVRVGITGAPGVGKSTFIETFGTLAIEAHQKKLAVLAVDPSSQRSGGSILGDKTRMETLSLHPGAYIRPSPAGRSLGGVTRNTREAILLCEAAGFDLIFVETVGVGQSETAVHSMVDFFLLLLLAGAGDELQGMKRGIMEMADAIAITKADGENQNRARQAQAEYQAALHLFPPGSSGWTPPVKTCSAREKTGMEELWQMLEGYLQLTLPSGYFAARRQDQSLRWMHETIQQTLESRFYSNPNIQEKQKQLEKQVLQGRISPFTAATEMLKVNE